LRVGAIALKIATPCIEADLPQRTVIVTILKQDKTIASNFSSGAGYRKGIAENDIITVPI
jgi:hypothetical protein